MSRDEAVGRGLRIAKGAAVGAATTGVASALGSLAAAAVFARAVVTPDRARPDDTTILDVDIDATTGAGAVELEAAPHTVAPGRYGLWLDRGAGHARLGDIISATPDRVLRRVEGVDLGGLAPGRARWNSYYYGGVPSESLGFPTEHIVIDGELGGMPAWLVPAPAPAEAPAHRWAVLVHGRGAGREEAIRAMPPLRAAGFTCLVPTYRNDLGVPAGPDGRYNLGLSEWRDVEAAVAYALAHGASEVLLLGWSMGGAITLQFLDRSELSGTVTKVILDGPVLDWGAILTHHARLNHVPRVVDSLARTLMVRSWGRRFVGVHEAIDVAQTDWVARADELHHPILLFHSDADETIPIAPARALAARRPDLVNYEEFAGARHCQEWNVDPVRWEARVSEFATAPAGFPSPRASAAT